MCHVILASPILALPLFLFLPFRAALPPYIAIILATAFVYFKIVAAMRSRVHTGLEGMTGGEAVVIEDIDPEGKVKFENEIWAATARGQRFPKGKKVRICGALGLELIVESSQG
jgi:membrane-bound ClpP family serine protease